MAITSKFFLNLQHGNPRQKQAFAALQETDIFSKLSRFSPTLAGTIPLDVDIETSDLDIICQSSDLQEFESTVKKYFQHFMSFECKTEKVRDEPSFIARFQSSGFDLEIFCQAVAIEKQFAVLHLNIEARLLHMAGPSAKESIRKLKQSGLKTEPAFAKYFKISGDPYEELAKMASWTELQLQQFVMKLTS